MSKWIALVVMAWPLAASAATVNGRVEVLDKSGRAARDAGDAVVWVDGPQVKPTPTRATIAMKDKMFSPHMVIVPVGSSVAFPNQDPIFHNAFSVSGDNRFDLDLYKKPKSGVWIFEHPGIVRVYCNIHPQMSAIVVVRDNPFFARATVDGSFRIENVPEGRYRLRAWHERAGETEREITVPADGAVQAALTLDASKWRKVPHKNKHGKDYSTHDRY